MRASPRKIRLAPRSGERPTREARRVRGEVARGRTRRSCELHPTPSTDEKLYRAAQGKLTHAVSESGHIAEGAKLEKAIKAYLKELAYGG
jgi:hypothetical protein